jgi:hypothetical protein
MAAPLRLDGFGSVQPEETVTTSCPGPLLAVRLPRGVVRSADLARLDLLRERYPAGSVGSYFWPPSASWSRVKAAERSSSP